MSDRASGNPQPRLNRQQSVHQRLEQNQQQIGGGLNCCTLPAAIAALIIAGNSDWENSSCNDGTTYTIDPVTFLYVAGGVQVGFAFFYFLGQYCKQDNCMKSLNGLTGALSLFYFIWAIIGLIMYDNQFSDDCKKHNVSLMILAWCIIDIAIRGLICCGLTCFICCAGCIAILGDDNANRASSDPLLSAV